MAQKIFEVVKNENPNTNFFDLSMDHKTTLDMGKLVPIFLQECLPGDRFTLGAEALLRFAPLTAPVMHKFRLTIDYWFVPNRLVWDNWNNYIGSVPGTAGIPAHPYVNVKGSGNVNPALSSYTKLMDYFGIPDPGASANFEPINAIPFAAYGLIYDTKYRDQNLVPPVSYKLSNGDNSALINSTLGILRNSAWEHDYFTSCLPFAQKGNPASIPVTGVAGTNTQVMRNNPGGGNFTFNAGPDAMYMENQVATDPFIDANALHVDLNGISTGQIAVNDLREAIALQKWAEKNARGGTRPDEIIKMHFGVDAGDARLNLPEYITGVKQNVSISEVLNTAGPDFDPNTGVSEGLPQGNMAGHGVSALDDDTFGSFYCPEHGTILGILRVLPNTGYQQGLAKIWTKTTDVTDYYWPDFAGLGEQPVKNKEIYAFDDNGTGWSNETFGYLPAYQDYRFNTNLVSGDFRGNLSYWHCGRQFASRPQLNQAFIECEPRKDIFAVTSPGVDSLYVHVANKCAATRPVAQFGTPTL